MKKIQLFIAIASLLPITTCLPEQQRQISPQANKYDTELFNFTGKEIKLNLMHRVTCQKKFVAQADKNIQLAQSGKTQTIRIDRSLGNQESIKLQFSPESNEKFNCKGALTVNILNNKGEVVYTKELGHAGMYFINKGNEQEAYTINEVME